MEIPVICRHCGKEEGLYEYGEINLGVFEAWRQTSVAWDASKNALVVTVSKRVEWEDPGIVDGEDEYKAAAETLADLYVKKGETDAGVLARATADAAIQVVVMDLHSILHPEQWPKSVNPDHAYWRQDDAGGVAVAFEWGSDIGEWVDERLTALLEQVGKPDLGEGLQAHRRDRLEELVQEYGRATLCDLAQDGDYFPRWALLERDADNGGPWWQLGDDWKELLDDSACQDYPEDWPAERIFDLDSEWSSGVELRYEAMVDMDDPVER